MAAGKTTVGRKLARELRCSFFDTDDLVAQQHGSVASIFEREGETAFRRYERAALAGVLEQEHAGVIALGGGAVTVPETRALLRDGTYWIFLKISPEQVLARVLSSREIRPLLGPVPSIEKIKELYDRRLPYYAAADHVIEAERLSRREILDEIVAWLDEKKIRLNP